MNDVFMKDVVKELRNKRMNDEAALNREIAARDRVDISLEKYEKMRDEISDLKKKCDDYLHTIKADNAIFEKIGISPVLIETIVNLNVEQFKDQMTGRTKIKITFECDEEV